LGGELPGQSKWAVRGMSRLDHDRNNRRILRRSLARERRYEQARSGSAVSGSADQAEAWLLAAEHAPRNKYCQSICDQVRAGHPVTTKQMAVLRKIHAERST